MSVLTKFKVTFITASIGISIYLLTSIFEMEVFEHIVKFLQTLEDHEADEIMLSFFLVAIGISIDLIVIKKNHEKKIAIQEQRLRVLKATMRTVQDIVNNFLNNMQFFLLEAQEKEALDKESLQLIDTIIIDTSDKLKQLGDLESTPERCGPGGVYQIDMKEGQ